MSITLAVPGTIPGMPTDPSKPANPSLSATVTSGNNTEQILQLFVSIDPEPGKDPIPTLASSLSNAIAASSNSNSFSGKLSVGPDLANQASGLLSSAVNVAANKLAGGLSTAANSLATAITGKLSSLKTGKNQTLAATGNLQAIPNVPTSLLGDTSAPPADPITKKLNAILPGFKVPGTPSLSTNNTTAIQQSLEAAGKEFAAKAADAATALTSSAANAVTSGLNAAASSLTKSVTAATTSAATNAVTSAASAVTGAATNAATSAANAVTGAAQGSLGSAATAAGNAIKGAASGLVTTATTAVADAATVVFADIQKQLDSAVSPDQLKLESKAAFNKITNIAKGIKIDTGPLTAAASTAVKQTAGALNNTLVKIAGGQTSLPGTSSSLSSVATSSGNAIGTAVAGAASSVIKSAEQTINKAANSALSALADKTEKLTSSFQQDLNVDLSQLGEEVSKTVNAALPEVTNLVKNLPVDVSTVTALTPDQAVQIKEQFAVASLAASGAIKNAIPGSIQTDLTAVAVQAKGLAANALSNVASAITSKIKTEVKPPTITVPGL